VRRACCEPAPWWVLIHAPASLARMDLKGLAPAWRPYRDDVDYFGVYCPDTDAVYLVPITDVPDRGACLRVKPTKNNQAKGVRWAKDYVLGDKVKVAAAAG
jgi:hypothetical protein